MNLQEIEDRGTIESVLRRNPELHIYGLGDLDDFYWPHTQWYGLTRSFSEGEESPPPEALAFLYTAEEPLVLLALSEAGEPMGTLIDALLSRLPARFYAHLSPGLETRFTRGFRVEPRGLHRKMALADRSRVQAVDASGVGPLGPDDLGEILELYRESYPHNWFDPRMLETGQYFGVRSDGALVCVAGVHVYSATYRVAALGNVAAHPAHRRRGNGTLATARVCQSLLRTVDHVGLNVEAANEAAISCYRKLGFEVIASYGEFMIERE